MIETRTKKGQINHMGVLSPEPWDKNSPRERSQQCLVKRSGGCEPECIN